MNEKLEPQFARLINTKGFIDCFWEMLSEFKTQEAAYEAVEEIHKSIFGKSKYKNFDSFRITMYKFLTTKK